MQKNRCHVQTWRDMFAGARLSCFISLNQLLSFESSTEENIYFWRRQAERDILTSRLLQIFVLSVYSNSYAYNASPTWPACVIFHIVEASTESLITATQFRTSLYLHHWSYTTNYTYLSIEYF